MAHILVADDDDLLAELLRFKFQQEGHEVTNVTDGEQALDALAANSFDLLVLDAMMPVKTGFAVLEELRAGGKAADLPIIMLTSRSSQEDVVNALRNGANDYITKPFIPDELMVRVNLMLAKSGANAPGAR